MAALAKNAISVALRDRSKRTKIWDHIQIVIRPLAKTFHDSSYFSGIYIIIKHNV